MSTYTENYNLIKPGDEDFYDVQEYNENMDTIDSTMAVIENGIEEIGNDVEDVSKKIGTPKTSGATVFSMLENGGGLQIKSIQRVVHEAVKEATSATVSIKTVNPQKCIVIFERLANSSTSFLALNYTLTANAINITHGYFNTSSTVHRFGFWVIEFN